jgi:hypothetical protein
MTQTKSAVVIENLAREFSRILKLWLTAEQMAQVVADNAQEDSDSSVCHSHDYCDANMAMAQALSNLGMFDPLDWNAAWDMAKANHFYISASAS